MRICCRHLTKKNAQKWPVISFCPWDLRTCPCPEDMAGTCLGNFQLRELCEAAIVSDIFVFGYWQDLLALQDKLRSRLNDFLKTILTDEMNYNHVDKIMAKKETFGLLICEYQIYDEDVDFSVSSLSIWI